MTVYSTDLPRLLSTITDTLGRRVAPALPDGPARVELAAVLEQLDNLAERLAWDETQLGQACERTEELAVRLGLAPDPEPAVDVDTLRRRRRDISETLGAAYRDGPPDRSLVDAVLEFSEQDVQEQISTTLRAGLPG
ncbi:MULTISPECIES: hypothetical protein [Rhodococcus]|uniref:Uncharacterized protein n=1 Tax=Rhodococcus oxybenzonivorans TaxID=1990687 RepID=A0AAE4V4I7_9NOCA|nr:MULTISPECIES: hypothetical protein [Rhodococcus]MDV7242693.1 hypothetical protein [Rhodococcus oxybenzonivorans]MDV7268676.1 hypothetical protein [Rhodococcus oxybenzonivorans]MDV7276126.1 hypothetical protein [Rhodococcus oxybenzonivorans]MDV7332181.1 hypothetical protein [Rhodococcus oxybenzonivorans]MDV7344386.1 hypothetical protein [Rhodococcus oxybenzonivorans]